MMRHVYILSFLSLLLSFTARAQQVYDIVKIQNVRAASHYMVATGSVIDHLSDTGDDKTKWIIRTVSDGVQLQNVGTGLYVSNMGSSAFELGLTPITLKQGTDGGYTIFEYKDKWMNASGSSSHVIGWSPIDSGSRWRIISTGESVNISQLANRVDAAQGLAQPKDGLYCKFFNMYYSLCMTEDVTAMCLRCKSPEANDYRQLWRLEAAGNGRYYIQNLYTQHYVKYMSYFISTVMEMTADKSQAGTYVIKQSQKTDVPRFYIIGNTDGPSYDKFHCDAAKNMVGWSAGTSGEVNASDWQFKAVNISEEEIKRIQEEYKQKADLLNGVEEYQQVLDQLFADKACTELKAGADFDALVAQLPTTLADMARKVKNNTWKSYASGTNWEKMFRIADYQIYSKHNGMSNVVGTGYHFGRLTNPTGISCQAGDILSIMVDQDIPLGSTLQLEIYPYDAGGATGTLIDLHKGLNMLEVEQWSTFFIFYEINNSDDKADNYIGNFPKMKIHIEGGDVCGYWDQTRGMTDKDWQALLIDGLLNFKRAQLKARHVLMNMNSEKVKAAIPSKVERVVKVWDDIVAWEQDMLGIDDRWIPNISRRFNCVFNATSIDNSYMYATNYGTYYNESTLSTILNYANITQNGENIWGPAHEFGHNHQQLFNMAGMTEVSNNVFSNMVVYKQGSTMSRGDAMNVIPDLYATGTHWIDYGIWPQTQLYWKLYQYFHLAGHDPLFYQKVFNIMRSDPLRRKQNVQLCADVDYLHFAEVCCQAAEMDLSELFECYGMFRLLDEKNYTVNNQNIYGYYVGDYGNFYLHVTQDMIDRARANMQAWRNKGKKKELKNLIFIDDRIEESPAFYDGAPAGTVRKPFDNARIGRFGDADCQWTRYAADKQKAATGYTYTLNGNTLEVSDSGANAVGFKVYNKEGKLVYFSAFRKFNLPDAVLEQLNDGDHVMAGQSDGTDIEIFVPGGSNGITEVNASDSSSTLPCYNLAGQRISQPRTGEIYIQGGKKKIHTQSR